MTSQHASKRMVNFYTDFVCCAVDRPADTCSIKDVAAHISYIKENAGIDHVGIGGDFDGVSKLPAGLDDVSTYPALIAELVANWGFSASDIQKVRAYGAKFVRACVRACVIVR